MLRGKAAFTRGHAPLTQCSIQKGSAADSGGSLSTQEAYGDGPWEVDGKQMAAVGVGFGAYFLSLLSKGREAWWIMEVFDL